MEKRFHNGETKQQRRAARPSNLSTGSSVLCFSVLSRFLAAVSREQESNSGDRDSLSPNLL
jgi:hypothetical protein